MFKETNRHTDIFVLHCLKNEKMLTFRQKTNKTKVQNQKLEKNRSAALGEIKKKSLKKC